MLATLLVAWTTHATQWVDARANLLLPATSVTVVEQGATTCTHPMETQAADSATAMGTPQIAQQSQVVAYFQQEQKTAHALLAFQACPVESAALGSLITTQLAHQAPGMHVCRVLVMVIHPPVTAPPASAVHVSTTPLEGTASTAPSATMATLLSGAVLIACHVLARC